MKLNETQGQENGETYNCASGTDLLKRMRRQSDGLSASMHSIAEFLLREGSGIANLGMGQVAALSYSSKATLVRYARQLGYDGWKSFRADFIEQAKLDEKRSMGKAKVDLNYPFDEDATTEEMVQSLVTVRHATHEILLDSLNTQPIDEAAQLVLGARHLVFLGNPPNRQYGELFAFNLDALGIDCRVPHNEMQEQELRRLDSRDCVIASSYSGDTSRELGRLVSMAHAREVATIAITGAGSPLAHVCTTALEYPPLEHYYTKIAGFYSCECMSLILDSLYSACYLANYQENKRGRLSLGEILTRSTNITDELAR